MSSMGICEYCKHIDKDIAERPCLHCSVNMGAFEFDLSEHDAKVRTEAIDKFADWLVEHGTLGNRCISDGEITDYGKVYSKIYKEQLKEKKDEN